MSYRKRYEDSYLDEESEDFDASISPADRLILYIQKKEKTERDRVVIDRLVSQIVGVEVWARILEVAESVGDRDMYYIATDKMSGV